MGAILHLPRMSSSPVHAFGSSMRDGWYQRVHVHSMGKRGGWKGRASLTVPMDHSDVKEKEGEASRKRGHPERETGENRTCEGEWEQWLNKACAGDIEMFPGLESRQGQSSTVALWLAVHPLRRRICISGGESQLWIMVRKACTDAFHLPSEAQGETSQQRQAKWWGGGMSHGELWNTDLARVVSGSFDNAVKPFRS